MKTFLSCSILLLVMLVPVLHSQNMENAGIDYTTALEKKSGDSRIKALEGYIKKYPDTSNIFTKLAYYWLAFDSYNVKNYDKAIAYGEKSLSLGGIEKKLEGNLYLILANSYGVKDSPKYNQGKAVGMADKAISFGREHGMDDISKQGQAIKKELTEPKAPKREPSNLEKIGTMYQQRKYDEAINFFKGLPEADKNNDKIFEIYSRSLLDAGKLDMALREFTDAYGKNKKGINAERLANIYIAKSKRDKASLDIAVDYYLEAHLLFAREGDRTRSDNDLKSAKYYLAEKTGLNRKIEAYNAKMKNFKPQPSNEKEIEKLQREYDVLEAKLNAKYTDMEPPAYETDKLKKIQDRIKELKRGGGTPQGQQADQELQAINKEQQQLDEIVKGLIAKAKKKLGM